MRGASASGGERSRQQILNIAPAMIWKTDAEGSFTNFSRRWCLFTGRSEEKERGRGWLDGVHPADLERWTQVYSRALRVPDEFSVDVRMRSITGRFHWVRHHGIPSFTREGEFSGYVGSSFDITDLKQAGQQALAEVSQLSHANQELESFVQTACHDLHEPLRTLQSQLAVLGQGPRWESGRLKDAMENVRRMQTLLQLVLESGAEITRDLLPVVGADATQLAQVFQNLIGNALKFRREEPVVVHVGARRDGDGWRLSVRDNGIGIAPDHHVKIFELFKRVPGTRRAGRGLGLTICKKIVERHGGRIGVESEPDQGSTFFFWLPD